MNLLGMGPGELIMIAMIGLVIFGPGKLPEIAQQIGRVVRDIRRSTADVTREFHEAMEPINEIAELPKAIGAGSVFAQKSRAAPKADKTEPGSAEIVATAPEPPLAEAGEWRWETSVAANGQQAQVEASPASSIWDWDAAPPAAEPVAPTETGASDSVWQWDVDAPASSPSMPTEPDAVPAPVASEPLNGVAAAPVTASSDGGEMNGEVVPTGVTVAAVAEGTAAEPGAEREARRRKKAAPAEDAV